MKTPLSGPWCLGVMMAAVGCKGATGSDDSAVVGDPPDIAGHYTMFVEGTNGCDDVADWIVGWADGPLLVEGTADALSFDFGDGIVVTGRVTASNTYTFSGDADYNAAKLAISNGGTVSSGDNGGWVVDGYFEVEVDDDEFTTNNCTISGNSHAVEVVGSN